ncbi:hypothetical protein D3C75_1297550 [compost metagenome]
MADGPSWNLQTWARNTALRALADYVVEWTSIELIGMSDSFTFRIGSGGQLSAADSR